MSVYVPSSVYCVYLSVLPTTETHKEHIGKITRIKIINHDELLKTNRKKYVYFLN